MADPDANSVAGAPQAKLLTPCGGASPAFIIQRINMTSEGPTEMENEGGEGRSLRMITDTIFHMKT